MSDGGTGGSRSVTLPAGGRTRTSLSAPVSGICQLPRTITFATARSFIEPTADNKAALADLLTHLRAPGPRNRLLIAGHTDSPGTASSNQALSERRTQSVQAVLANDQAPWETLFGSEGWGDPELTAMIVETGEASAGDTAGIAAALARYRGSAGRTNRSGLYTRYFARLLAGATVPSITAASPATLGFGEEQLLRGSRTSPSKDPSQPRIEGEFRPNRRVEFFFAEPSVTINRADYPRWTLACTVAPPPATITVTIAPLDSVQKGRTADVQVTINPSPLPASTTVTLTLSTTSGTGEARFASTSSNTMTISQSGPVTIQGVTESSATDNIRITATVTGQAAVLAQEDFTVTNAINIFVKFEVWNLTTHAFEPLPAGADVDITDYDPVSANDTLATRQTDAQGRVAFSLSALVDPDESAPDIFFLVHTNGRSHAGHTLPQEWSTKGWKATDGNPGYYPDYAGAPIGTPTTPLVFRIGLNVHVRLVYQDLHGPTPTDSPAPKGVPVDVHVGAVGTLPKGRFRTNEQGEVHAVLFNADAGDDVFFHIDFEIEDASINLPRARVQMAQVGWSTFWSDTDRKYFPNNDRTSIGTQTAPEILRCTVNERNVALYFLKIVRELSVFLFRMTGGAWTGVSGLTLFRTSVSGVAYSWPVGEVNIPPSDHWDRSTIAHELTHQTMWKEVDIGTLGVAYNVIRGNLQLYHVTDLLANPVHALIEGWAEFIEAVFVGTTTPPYSVTTLRPSHSAPATTPLGPPPPNRGESVEGALADGLWAIFQNHVVTSAVSASANVPESVNGDIVATAPWLTNTAVRDRFLSMIWRPFQDLKSASNRSTTTMFANIRSRNASTWHALQAELQAFNMAMDSPTFGSISPGAGLTAGGESVTITGTNFVRGMTVTIGGVAATAVTVVSSTSLTATTPAHAAGRVDVVVTTPAGSATGSGAFIFADMLLRMIDVQPRRGPVTGGTRITITADGLVPGAQVFVGSQGATGVTQVASNQLQATTPAGTAGAVEVAVTLPDGQSDRIDPGFEYVPGPRIIDAQPRSGPASGGTQVTITGDNFDPAMQVFFAGQPALAVTALPGEIVVLTPALVPPRTPGFVDITVRNPDGQEDTAQGGYQYQ